MSNPQAERGVTEVGGEERASDMATLLHESVDYQAAERGEIVEGVVVGWDRDGVIVDIGMKSEGVVPRHEMQSLGSEAQSLLQAGEKVLVAIVNPETAEGQVLLSIDRARGEHGWRVLQDRFESGETFEGQVTGYNRGGLLVNVEGVNAFVPLSQVVGVRPDRNREEGGSNSLAEQVGRSMRLKVIEINRRRNRVILSERAALQEWRLQQKERLIQELREGDIRRGRISSIRNFGVFVDLGGADGLAHLSELTWERGKTPTDLFKVGDEVDAYVTKVDHENKKIALSLRRANPAQWDAIVDKYQEGQVVTGLVTKLVPFGAFARIEGPVEGLIHVSELVDRRIGHPKEVVREGDLLPLKIVRVERDRHRLGLSLRRARDEGETMGYVFSDGGEVLSVPEDIRSDFEAREGPIAELAPPPEPSADEEPAMGADEASVATDEAPFAGEAEASLEEAVTQEAAAEEPAMETLEEEAPLAEAAVEPEAVEPAEAEVSVDEPPVEAEEPAATAVSEAPTAVETAEVEAPAAMEVPAEEPAASAPEIEEAPVAEEAPEAVEAEEPPTAEEPEEAPAGAEETEAAADEVAAVEEPKAIEEAPAGAAEASSEDAPAAEEQAAPEDEEQETGDEPDIAAAAEEDEPTTTS